jgi:riboflavin synthase
VFTGLVEELGTITQLEKQASNLLISIRAHKVLEDLKLGDSLALDGVCQTVIEINSDEFKVCAIPQTLSLTNFTRYQIGHKVNLERPLRIGDRLGGHLVQGHIDGVAIVSNIINSGQSITLELTDDLLKYTIDKGSITLNGISLTIAAKQAQSITVCIIPMTLELTNISSWQVADRINVEVDMFAKYILQNLNTHIGK